MKVNLTGNGISFGRDFESLIWNETIFHVFYYTFFQARTSLKFSFYFCTSLQTLFFRIDSITWLESYSHNWRLSLKEKNRRRLLSRCNGVFLSDSNWELEKRHLDVYRTYTSYWIVIDKKKKKMSKEKILNFLFVKWPFIYDFYFFVLFFNFSCVLFFRFCSFKIKINLLKKNFFETNLFLQDLLHFSLWLLNIIYFIKLQQWRLELHAPSLQHIISK